MNWIIISLEAWVQPAWPRRQQYADISPRAVSSGATPSYEVEMNDGNGYFDSGRENGYYICGGGTPTRQFNYLVSTYDGTNWNLYVDAALVGQTAEPVVRVSLLIRGRLGNGTDGGAGRYFTGNICQVALYTNALTPARVVAHLLLGLYRATNVAPVILTQPVSQRVAANNTVTFGVVAVGRSTSGLSVVFGAWRHNQFNRPAPPTRLTRRRRRRWPTTASNFTSRAPTRAIAALPSVQTPR